MTGHLNKSDTSLWLHNKLGNVNDLWSGGSICSQLNADVLKNIRDCFPDLQSLVKLKLLVSFLHLPRRNVELWRSELEEIVEVASIDSDQWVSMVAELLKCYPETGQINFSIDENATVFTDLLTELKKFISVRKPSDQGILPIESLYLNVNAFIAQIGAKPQQPVKHFTLRRKPKSAALRAELLQKSNEVATSAKKNLTTPTAAARYRGPKELNDNTPLKGIPSSRTSFGSSISTFKTPNPTNRSAGSVRNPTRPTIPGVRGGGIKLLDIGEQPLGRDAKRKKRNQEETEAKTKEGDKTNGQDSTATPDYALGLTSMVPPSPAPAYSVPPTPGPYVGESSTSKPKQESPDKQPTTKVKSDPESSLLQPNENYSSSLSSTVPAPVSSSITASTPPAPTSSNLSAMTPLPASSTVTAPIKSQQSNPVQVTQITIVPNKQPTSHQVNLPVQNQPTITIQPQQVQRSLIQQQSIQQQQQPVPQQHIQQPTLTTVKLSPGGEAPIVPTVPTPATATTAPKLQLSQRQILEAQELFKNSNTVGKVEKALILSFMGGSRENPCPHLGDIVTLKLSEKEEQIRQADGAIINVIAENHYQMNYRTGEAKQIKKLRRIQ